MIKVTMKDGVTRWIAAGQVVIIGPGEKPYNTVSFSNGNMITVRDEIEDLVQRIHEVLIVA